MLLGLEMWGSRFLYVVILMLFVLRKKGKVTGWCLIKLILITLKILLKINVSINFSLYGRMFTWYKGDGYYISRIDRFVLSEDWYIAWPNCIQVAQPQGLSDHCPIMLSVDEENWGP